MDILWDADNFMGSIQLESDLKSKFASPAICDVGLICFYVDDDNLRMQNTECKFKLTSTWNMFLIILVCVVAWIVYFAFVHM